MSRDTFSHLHLHVVPCTICRLTFTLSLKEHSPRIKNHYMIQIKTRTKQNQHTHRRAWSNTGTSHRYTRKNTHKTKSHRTTKTSIPLRACASTKVPITLATGATHRSLHCRRTYPQVSIKNENVHSEGILVLTSAEVHATTRWPLNASCLVSP